MPLRPVHKVAITVGLLIAAVVITWLLLPEQASVDCVKTRFERRPTFHLRGNALTIDFIGNQRLQWLQEQFGMIADDSGVVLSAGLQLVPPIEPGVYWIEGTAKGKDASDWTFTPAPAHSPKVKSAGLVLNAVFGSPETVEQAVTGTITLEVANESQLTGRLELEARGQVGCPGEARVSTPFTVERGSPGEQVRTGY